jgi:hypothetical protein
MTVNCRKNICEIKKEKNNMQKRKSFLMKILVLLTVVFCTFALAFGMVGCAADGKDGKDGVGIASVQIVDGVLTITLTNGETIEGNVKGETGASGADTLTTQCPVGVEGKHVFAKHVVQAGTCAEEEILMNTCVLCNGYEIVVGEKNDEVHGAYEWALNDDDVYELKFVEYFEEYEGTDAETLSGACKLVSCKLCDTLLEQHKNMQKDVPVFETNPCISESLVADYCLECKAFVGAISKSEPTGHNFEYLNDDHVDGSKADFIVSLKCTECNEIIEATATRKADVSVVADCKNEGFDIFEYSYDNGVSKENWPEVYEEFTETLKYNKTGTADVHVLTDGTNKLYFQSNVVSNRIENYDVDKDDVNRRAALDALFEAGLIKWSEDVVPANCEANNSAIFTCACCGDPVVIKMTAKHDYVETKKDCTHNGYYECSACGHDYTTEEQIATGHVWEFKSFDATNVEITVECSICKEPKTVRAERDTTLDVVAKNCQEKSYEGYKTTGLTNGIDATPVVKTHKHQIETKLPHAIKGSDVALYAISNSDKNAATHKEGKPYDYETYADYFGKNDPYKLDWNEGEPADCTIANAVIFKCDDCDQLIVTSFLGEHNIEGVEGNTNEPDHGERYVTTKTCKVCSHDVVVDSKNADDHNFVATKTTWDAFVADPDVGDVVRFECACGDYYEVAAKYVDANNPYTTATGCVSGKIYHFVFEKDYTIEAAYEGTIPKKITKTYDHYETTGKHWVTNEFGIVTGQDYQYADIPEGLINDKIVWSENKAGTCSVPNKAIFTCIKCNAPVAFNLYGEHVFSDAESANRTNAATCQAPGTVEKKCSACEGDDGEGWVVVDTIPQLVHVPEWTFVDTVVNGVGANVYVESGVLYGVTLGSASGVCKNAGCTAGTVHATVTYELVPATCCKAGSIVVTYKNGDQVIKTESKLIELGGAHTYLENNSEDKQAYYVDFGAKTVYEFKWCSVGNNPVLVATYAIVDGELADGAQFDVVYDQEGKQVVISGGKAYIIETEAE